MTHDADVNAAVAEFVGRVSELSVLHSERLPLSALEKRSALRDRPWYYLPGVYAFYNGRNEVRYVGRALIGVGGISARICDHVRAKWRGDELWDDVLDDPQASVELWAFSNSDETWVPSLELFLTGRFRAVLLNRRAC